MPSIVNINKTLILKLVCASITPAILSLFTHGPSEWNVSLQLDFPSYYPCTHTPARVTIFRSIDRYVTSLVNRHTFN